MPPKTNCKKCIFAIKKDGTQIDCEHNIKHKLVNQFPSLFSEDSFEIVDDSWLINDFLCPVGKSNIDESKTLEENLLYTQQISQANIYLIYFIDNNLDIFEKNLQTLKESFVKPKFLSIVKPKNLTIQSKEIIYLLDKYGICKWKIHNLFENLDYYQSVDLVLATNTGNNNTKYYCVWDNSIIPELYFNTVSDSLIYLYSKSPIIAPVKQDPYPVGCVIPFIVFKNENHVKSHQLVMDSINNYNNKLFIVSIA